MRYSPDAKRQHDPSERALYRMIKILCVSQEIFLCHCKIYILIMGTTEEGVTFPGSSRFFQDGG